MYLQTVFEKIITRDNLTNLCSTKYSGETLCCNDKFIFTEESCSEGEKVLEKITLDNHKEIKNNVMTVLQELCLKDNSVETKWNIMNNFLIFFSDENIIKLVELNVKIINPEFLHIIETLLTKFCSIIFSSYRTSQSTTQDLPELKVLNRLLRFLLVASNTNLPRTTSLIMENSDIVNHLMMLLSFTATKIFTEMAQIAKLTYEREVFGNLEKQNDEAAKQLFEKCFGFTVTNENFQIEAYLLNINNKLIGSNNLKFAGENTEEMSFVNSMKTMQIIVMNVLSCQHLLVYITNRWAEILHQMSKSIQTTITDGKRTGKQNAYCTVGDIVGFRSNDVMFERIVPVNVKFLRGQILAVTHNCVMLWAMDVGLIGYSSMQHIKVIYNTEIVSQPALMKICKLKNPLNNFETDIFLNSSNLLLLMSKYEYLQVKQMLLSECGDHFITFLKYPRYSVRLTTMKLLLSLADSCKDVVKFMEKHHLHTFLADKLACYAHAYRSKMYSSEADFSMEIIIMTKLLSLILEEVLLYKWKGHRQAIRALKLLFDAPGLQLGTLVTESLHLLGENPKHVIRCSIKDIDVGACPRTFQKITSFNEIECLHASKNQNQELEIKVSEDKGSEHGHHILSRSEDYYIFGSKVSVVQDETHELMQQQKLDDISESELSKALCGLLNNNVKSSLYFGISRDSIVTGIVLFRETKDIFRNGVDRIMSKCLLPEVKANCYDVTFSPILNSQDKLTDISQRNLYVIEICVHPSMYIAYIQHQSRHCFIRKGGHTFETTVMQKKNYMMEVEEAIINDNVKDMDLESLTSYVQDYIKQHG